MLYKCCNRGNILMRQGNSNIFEEMAERKERKDLKGCEGQDVKWLLLRLTIIGTLRSLLSWIALNWQAIMFRSTPAGPRDLSFWTRLGIAGNRLWFAPRFRRGGSQGKEWSLSLNFRSTCGSTDDFPLLWRDFSFRIQTSKRGNLDRD